ncbi:hypothetical protein E2C01_069701 [Portunus trituberculatus]|uniref:Uncharacterized protein n=1 Tax=Portunus trituberculatus TaxID=210409 RepID=A0A5B7I3I0_PORTR|nr:hypothetical protein [Portunus trituberculatus]
MKDWGHESSGMRCPLDPINQFPGRRYRAPHQEGRSWRSWEGKWGGKGAGRGLREGKVSSSSLAHPAPPRQTQDSRKQCGGGGTGRDAGVNATQFTPP